MRDKVQKAELGKEWRKNANADFEIASEHKLIAFQFYSILFKDKLFWIKIYAIKKENLLFFYFCTVIKATEFSQKSDVQPGYLGHFKGMYNS